MTALSEGAKNNVQTTTYDRRERGLKIRFILPSIPIPKVTIKTMPEPILQPA